MNISEYTDCRGTLYNFPAGFKIIKTVKGALRSGDIHPCNQHDYVISGTVRIEMPHAEIVLAKGDKILIPAGVPHLFYSVTDSTVCEWWDGDFEAEYWAPYRDRVDAYLERNGVKDGETEEATEVL